ncbi:hypothetical protein FB451DRAFT_1237578, partial [Mycena latifolia]
MISHKSSIHSLTTSELVHHTCVAAIVAAGVQSFYVWRICTLSGRKRLLPSLLIILVAWQIIGLAPYNFLVFGPSSVSAGRQNHHLTLHGCPSDVTRL